MRSFLALFLLSSIVSSTLFSKDMVEIFAKQVKATNEYVDATGDVVLLYDGALIKAAEAHYDKNASLLTFSGGVEMIKRDENKLFSEDLEINTINKEIKFKKLLLTTEDDLWIDAKSADRKEDIYTISNSILSSCNQKNPEWTIEFAEAQYHKTKNYVTLKDAKVTFFNVPIFYSPYLAFPTLDKRTTGLLIPSMRLTTSDGLVYEQPYFYAPRENIDVEFDPQIRTSRGYGGHITTRFVDSNQSHGQFKFGYFKNYKSYQDENNFNQEHYGAEFTYESTDFLPQKSFLEGYENGLYVNATYLNDLEYLNLQKDSASSLLTSNLVESRLNAFVYDEKNYFGLYGRYNIDTSKKHNTSTLQELPALHYHSFIDYLVSDRLFYTFDARVHNYTRPKGSRAVQTEFDLPITYYDSFFNDYIDFSITENLYFSNVFFSNLEEDAPNYHFYRNFHTVELSSDLSRQYGSNVHTLHPSIVYTKPSMENEEPSKYKNLTEEQKELFVTQTKLENFSIGLSQYLYNSDLDMNFFHRLALTRYADALMSKGDLNNELGYTKDNLNLYTNIFFSLDENKLHSITSSINYSKSDYDIMLTHFYDYNLILDKAETNTIQASYRKQYDRHNQWFANADFDLENAFNHQWKIGWEHRQKCWGAKLSIGQEQIPNVERSFRNNMLYFELSLNPLGSISKNVEKEFSRQGSN